jgi:hypothetical protein
MNNRKSFDLDAYTERIQNGPCFICEMIAGRLNGNHIIQQGNSHVHWHIAPLPFGVPFKEQQLEALKVENGVLDMSDDEMEALARKIQQALD